MFSTKEIQEELKACTLKVACGSARPKSKKCISSSMIRERSINSDEIVYSTERTKRYIRV